MQYTSEELREMASGAPISTAEEDIEAACQKSITEAQLEFQDKVTYLHSEEFSIRYYQKFPQAQNIHYEAQLQQTEESLRAHEKSVIEAIKQLKDYRMDAYQAYLNDIG